MALGAIIILGLGVYAFRLLALVKSQKDKKQAVRNKRVASMQSSIQTIAFAIQQQQCDLSEGVIRICRLLEAMPVDPHPDYAKAFPSTHELFDKVKSYPTHEARTLLTKSERRKQDRERQELESLLESKILKETEALRKLEVA
ncbi:MAG: hypothetical protein ACJAVV_002120 [Alphaproteobacteria bacterium]|jgi:hypothetical protein